MPEKAEMNKGVVFGIQFFSIHDGPGIRTAVFLKGCNLHCAWCHNPESLQTRCEIMVAGARCIGCGLCAKACKCGVHAMENGILRHHLGEAQCTGCGLCEEACPSGAIRLMGKEMTVEEVLCETRRDARYYHEDGGLTITGGEPTMQHEFMTRLAEAASKEQIGVYIETNGTAKWEVYERLLPFLRGVLIDYKLTDPDAHLHWTGVRNERIRENIIRLSQSGKDVVVRCPIIPGINDTEDHLRAIAQMTKNNPGIRGAEIMPYHRLGIAKARQIGWGQERIREFAVPPTGQVNSWKETIRALGGRLV